MGDLHFSQGKSTASKAPNTDTLKVMERFRFGKDDMHKLNRLANKTAVGQLRWQAS